MNIHDKKINIKNKFCFECNKEMHVSYGLKKVDGPKEWMDVSFYAPLLECKNCNDSFFPPEYAKIAHEASCKAAGVLTPDEIKSIRKNISWGNNNVVFSQILGFGSSTIARYESGASIPSKVHNKILNFLKYPDVLQDFENSIEYQKYFKNKKIENDLKETINSDNLNDSDNYYKHIEEIINVIDDSGSLHDVEPQDFADGATRANQTNVIDIEKYKHLKDLNIKEQEKILNNANKNNIISKAN